MNADLRSAFFVLALTLVACSQNSSPPATSPVATRKTSATATPRPATTVLPNPTPEDIAATVQALTRALQVETARDMSALLLNENIWLAEGPNGDTGEAITRDAALDWLNTHWGRTHTVVSHEYTDHFVLLEVKTVGWPTMSPIREGLISFHLHRYNDQGEPDPVLGHWRIDAILYQ